MNQLFWQQPSTVFLPEKLYVLLMRLPQGVSSVDLFFKNGGEGFVFAVERQFNPY